MIPAATIAKLATLGLTPFQAEAVAVMLSEVEQATEAKAGAAVEARRKADRDRQAKHRGNVMSRDITLQNVTCCDSPLGFPLGSPQRDIIKPPSSPLSSPPKNLLLAEKNRERDEFCEKAWKIIPHRKSDSFKPFRKAVLKALTDGESAEEITAGIVAYARSERNADPQFRKGAAAWVNDHKWKADWAGQQDCAVHPHEFERHQQRLREEAAKQLGIPV